MLPCTFPAPGMMESVEVKRKKTEPFQRALQ